ncbi:low temperature requirement protein A [Mycolicibacterium aromaticivorans]|uniref:low temperature requirement protein A n=1 Tax=Mycolicibacterium aromaticivorans TaxID=318425 RepID=UPI003B50E1DF
MSPGERSRPASSNASLAHAGRARAPAAPDAGRDPHEGNRVASPRELLFDLALAVAFGVAASEFAHLLSQHHIGAALAGYTFSAFAICWAWINFTYFRLGIRHRRWGCTGSHDDAADGRRHHPGWRCDDG